MAVEPEVVRLVKLSDLFRGEHPSPFDLHLSPPVHELHHHGLELLLLCQKCRVCCLWIGEELSHLHALLADVVSQIIPADAAQTAL